MKLKNLVMLAIIVSSLFLTTLFIIVVAQPGIPTDFTATTISKTCINLSWVKGSYSDTTCIERNLSSSWIRGEGTLPTKAQSILGLVGIHSTPALL